MAKTMASICFKSFNLRFSSSAGASREETRLVLLKLCAGAADARNTGEGAMGAAVWVGLE